MKAKVPDMPWLECLIRVRERIDSGQSVYICFAIDSVLHKAHCEESLTTKYQQRIQDQLGDCDTYWSWLARNHPGVVKKALFSNCGAQPGRLAWLDNMIKLEKERLSK